jgi:hypothetical protein
VDVDGAGTSAALAHGTYLVARQLGLLHEDGLRELTFLKPRAVNQLRDWLLLRRTLTRP